MTYKTFLDIVAGHKKWPSWVFDKPIRTTEGSGKMIVREGSRAILSKDLAKSGTSEEQDISNMIIDEKIAVREVFERFNDGVNR